jgi:multicomponent Na+:H+ antiporter subunit G
MTAAGAIVAGVLLVVGSAFVLVAAVGVVRMPDLYTRMHAASKAGTLGAIGLLAGAAVAFGDGGSVLRAVLAGVFVALTAPVAAHVIARSAFDRADATESHSANPDPAPESARLR